MTVDPSSFIGYLNRDYLEYKDPNMISIEHTGTGFRASLIIRAEQDYRNGVTVQFVLRFQHLCHGGERVFQREFRIEHHATEKSKHTRPHVQLYMHGPALTDKVGQIWITLPLLKEEDYVRCIEGFFAVLVDVIAKCEPGLEKVMLDTDAILTLDEQKAYLLTAILDSLKTKAIEFENPDGKRIVLNPKNYQRVISKDSSLLPFFNTEADQSSFFKK